MNPISRRDVIKGAALAPLALSRLPGLRWLPRGDDRSVVVVELAGGNDGLNTLIPTDEPAYAKLRPTLAGERGSALPLADGIALHPALTELRALFERGLCCAVQGVGYEPPDRSHFRSRDIWYTADPSLDDRAPSDPGRGTTGWLGRAGDVLASNGVAVPGLSIGSLGVPLALRGKTFVAPSLRRLADYELLVDARGGRAEVRREEVAELVRSAADRSGKRQDLATFIGEVGRSALDSEARLRRALGSYAPRAEFPQGQFGDALGLLSRVIVSGFGTRLFHLSLGGFDTHASQAPTHAGLLRLLSRGLGALVRDLEAHRALDGVTILVYSEFGRRVAENRSQGTDHGAAAPVLVLGSDLDVPVHGTGPDFDDLIDGDVRPTTDFRRVYASLCRRLGVPAEAVVGNGHEPLELWT